MQRSQDHLLAQILYVRNISCTKFPKTQTLLSWPLSSLILHGRIFGTLCTQIEALSSAFGQEHVAYCDVATCRRMSNRGYFLAILPSWLTFPVAANPSLLTLCDESWLRNPGYSGNDVAPMALHTHSWIEFPTS